MLVEDYKAFGTSQETVARATRILKSGNTKVIEAVSSGKMAASMGDKVISGRQPGYDQGAEQDKAKAKPRAKAATANDEKLKSEPKKAGRPMGDRRVNAVMRALDGLLQFESEKAAIKKLWPRSKSDKALRGIALLKFFTNGSAGNEGDAA